MAGGPPMGEVTVCAVDDEMGRWPRFGGDRFASPEHFVPFAPED
jgi:hypothetical protein